MTSTIPAMMISTETSWKVNSRSHVSVVYNSSNKIIKKPNKIIKAPTTSLTISPLSMITHMIIQQASSCLTIPILKYFELFEAPP